MKRFLPLFLFASALARGEECLGYGEIQLVGMLTAETFAGPPNFESTSNGDRAETYFFVSLPTPTCVSQGDASGLEPAVSKLGRVQLIFPDASAYKTLRLLVGKQVSCQGKFIGAHTGHHHSAVLLSGAQCVVAQQGAQADSKTLARFVPSASLRLPA